MSRKTSAPPEEPSSSRRMSKAARRQQLIDTAFVIIRNEGADKLTLGYLAAQAGVSKPIAYDHFGTRSALLIALYKAMDVTQSNALRKLLTAGDQGLHEVIDMLAAAYIHCAVDTGGEWHAVGAALSGSEEMGAVHQDLLAGYVHLFASILKPHTALGDEDLHRRCIGLVGAGEALVASMLRGHQTEAHAAATFAVLIRGALVMA